MPRGCRYIWLKYMISTSVTQAIKPPMKKIIDEHPHKDTYVYPIRNSLYINLGNSCTLKCDFCPKHNGTWLVHDYDMSLEKPPAVSEVTNDIGDPAQWDEIVFCGYGEPTLRLKELIAIATWVKGNGGKVRVNTDGLGNLANKRNILPELSNCVDGLSISMNAHNKEIYNRHCKPGLEDSWEAMLEFSKEAPKWISDVTVSAINGLEGVDIEKCKALALTLGVQFKERNLDVVG